MGTDHSEQLVTISEAERMTTLERTTIWRKYKAGEFPQPRYIGERRVWPKSEIEEWLKAEMSRPREARRGARNLNPNSAPGDASDAT